MKLEYQNKGYGQNGDEHGCIKKSKKGLPIYLRSKWAPVAKKKTEIEFPSLQSTNPKIKN